MEFDKLSKAVLDAAFKVHTALGPGLFEQVYKVCLKHEIQKQGLKACSEVVLPVNYDGIEIELGYRIDLIVQESLILELKAVHQFAPIHKAQLINYPLAR